MRPRRSETCREAVIGLESHADPYSQANKPILGVSIAVSAHVITNHQLVESVARWKAGLLHPGLQADEEVEAAKEAPAERPSSFRRKVLRVHTRLADAAGSSAMHDEGSLR